MKRHLFLLSLLLFALSAVAQSADSVAFVNAKRNPLKIKGAKGYTVAVELFDAPQNISVFNYSPKRFTTDIVQTKELTPVSVVAKRCDAALAINACFWNVRTVLPKTFVKSNGKVLSLTDSSCYPYVNGLVFLHDKEIDVLHSLAMPDYKGLVEGCDDVFASGPLLIEGGKSYNYDYCRNADDEELRLLRKLCLRRHPRSVIGCDDKGNIYLVVVDGRSRGNAEGMTMSELTALCRWMGMVEAVNLDGGGSSALWSCKHGIINHPSDNKRFDHEGERKVSSCIVVRRR